MPRLTDADRGPIALAEKVLHLLDEGQFTATYKYAVLLGLMDLCLENTTATGAPPDVITTRQLAEKIVELYWPQTVAYPFGERPDVLKQNRGRQAAILSAILRFRSEHAGDPTAPLTRARRAAPWAFERLVRDVEWTLIRYPLLLLQVVGGREDPFLYTLGWDRSVRQGEVAAYQRGAGAFDNRILLRPRVGEYLVRLNGVLRPLIHRLWAAMVADINRLEEVRLERFLFGAERVPTESVRPGLQELQRDRCFYCEAPFMRRRGRRPEVDHFIPWARHPNNAIENLVVAHERCNGYKRDFLAAHEHVHAWRERLGRDADDLARVAETGGWERDAERSLSVARATYLHLPEGYQLWLRDREFAELDLQELAAALA
jgi:5-methylcytosine-specific restriction endonuclease McrA